MLYLITFVTSIPALLLYQPVLDDPVGYGVPTSHCACPHGGGSDAINGQSADGGALGAAALDTSSQELLI